MSWEQKLLAHAKVMRDTAKEAKELAKKISDQKKRLLR